MSNPDHPERPSKRARSREARKLRLRPEWDPGNQPKTTRQERLRNGIEQGRVASTFEAAGDCQACAVLREDQGDPTALCPEHLRKAMGL